MDQKLKQTLIDYGKQVVVPLINDNAEDAKFTNEGSGITSATITDAIKETYSKAVAAQTTADAATAAAKAAHDAANTAGTKAQNAYNAANNAANDAANAQNTANTAVTNAAAADSKAQKAYDAANAAGTAASNAQSTANSAYEAANDAQTTADKAVADAASAQADATQALADAASAQTTANSAVSAANTAQTTADSAVSAASAAASAAANAHNAANAIAVAQSGAKIQFTNAAGTTADVTEFTMTETTGTGDVLKSYTLKMGATPIGTVDIPKDFLVKSATVEECEVANVPVQGYKVGDKYIDFVINAKEGTGTESHVYLLVNDLVDAYTAGAGITISNENVVALDAANVAMNSSSDVSNKGIVVHTSGNLSSFKQTVSVTEAASLSDGNVLTGTGLGNMLPSTTTDFTEIYNAINAANNASTN